MENYPLNYNYWESILGRRLNDEEKEKFKNVQSEKNMNKVIHCVYWHAVKNGLYIPILTENDGNCLFHCLCYYKFADDIKTLKRGLSNMLLFFRDMKNFIPGQDMTLAELFGLHNDIENIFCYKEQNLYKYNYDAMCLDLLLDDGWKRINTELLFTVLSIIMNKRFIIYHDNKHITNICPNENKNTKNIYLAQLGECHYIPLDLIQTENPPKCLEYKDSHNEFIEWVNKILIENSNQNENEIEDGFIEYNNNCGYFDDYNYRNDESE